MNNAGFIRVDETTKRNNLAGVLYKRCNGLIDYCTAQMLSNKVNVNKQMKIDIVDKSVFEEEVKLQTISIISSERTLTRVDIQWVTVLLGKVDMGVEDISVIDGDTKIDRKTSTKVISGPVVALVEEQSLGDIDIRSSRLIIYLR